MQRYFALKVDDNIYLDEKDVFHCVKVMRMRLKEQLIVLYEGEAYLGEVISLSPFIVKNLGKNEENNREMTVKTTLFFALAKGDKIDFVIQKATELGVSNIVLVKTERCVVKMDNDDLAKKIENRYYRIAKEASEQSERRVIPAILGVYDIKNIPTNLLADINLIAYEGAAFDKINLEEIRDKKSVSILIGPEGGFSKEEVDSVIKQGFKTISLGKRILRTETAAVAALAMINMVIEG